MRLCVRRATYGDMYNPPATVGLEALRFFEFPQAK